MTRAAVLLGLALVTSVAGADQLMLMPTARHLAQGLVRTEVWGDRHPAAGAITAGLSQSLDGELTLDRFGNDPARPTASFAYYYLTPIADITPGICGGILDAANATRDGRRLYACATLNRALPKLERFGYTEVTAGVSVGRRSGPMAGFRMPVARTVSLLAEYDGYRFNVGMEDRMPGGAYVRLAARAGVFYAIIGFRG